MSTYVIGDLHGNWKGFRQCLELCAFSYPKDTLIQLGDVVDGGEEVYECIEELLKISNLIAIKGNHDDWFLEFSKSGYHPANWLFGGIGTVKSYSFHRGKTPIIIPTGNGFKVSLNPGDIPKPHQEFFERQLLYYIDNDNNLFVHGGFNRFQPFADQRSENYYWNRTLWQDALEWQIQQGYANSKDEFEITTPFKNIFLGHTSTLNWRLTTPLKVAHIYNLDTGSGETGRLTIMNVQTKKFWQSDPTSAQRS